jgi:hypothetical protein
VVDPKKRDKKVQVYAATWYSNAPSNIEIGNKVEVTVVNGPRIAMAQYPERDEALEVKIIQNSKLEGAELAEFGHSKSRCFRNKSINFCFKVRIRSNLRPSICSYPLYRHKKAGKPPSSGVPRPLLFTANSSK